MTGRKNTLLKFQTFHNANMAGDLISPVTNVQYLDNIGIQLNFVGDAAGAFDVQISADYAQDSQGVVTNAGHWVNLVLTPAPVAAGADDSIYIDINQTSAPWIRTVYTASSGASSLNGYMTAKMV